MTLIRAEHLVKTYRTGEVEVAAVKGVDFVIGAKSFVAFVRSAIVTVLREHEPEPAGLNAMGADFTPVNGFLGGAGKPR